ncbi:hypothetical protein LSH36_412g01005 [Paralvinella palmiformis]|uniref:Uncharacterized protein n=1 Tax=Paralvinella palmiformis TaxID=53620 RepID=A0AAD9JDB2_9ANNE|nr:hypothetical protein LSH36_412g01005 [Paralvinella palmiformis]
MVHAQFGSGMIDSNNKRYFPNPATTTTTITTTITTTTTGCYRLILFFAGFFVCLNKK